MGQPRFYVDVLTAGDVTLDAAESRHLRASRRLSEGDEVVVSDGRGGEATGHVGPRTARSGLIRLVLGEVRTRPPRTPELTLAMALPKAPRQDWLIEKCTELGVRAIRPIVTTRSIAEASAHRVARWRQIAIEAAKQSGQAWLPELHEAVPLPELLATLREYEAAYIASGDACVAAMDVSWPQQVLVLIGPEGDWTPQELDAARRAGAREFSLGPNILRIETAAVSVASLVHARMQPH